MEKGRWHKMEPDTQADAIPESSDEEGDHPAEVTPKVAAPPTGSSGCRRPNFSTKEKEYLKYLKLMPPYFREPCIDILIINTPGDEEGAKNLKKRLEAFTFNNSQNVASNPCVRLLSEFHDGDPHSLDKTFHRSVFIFFYITEKFCSEPLTLFLGNACLQAAIKEKSQRVVNIFTVPQNDRKLKIPMMIDPLKAIHVYDKKAAGGFNFEDVKQLLESRSDEFVKRGFELDERRRKYFEVNSKYLKNLHKFNSSQRSSEAKHISPDKFTSAHRSSSDMGYISRGVSASRDTDGMNSNDTHATAMEYTSLPEHSDLKAMPENNSENMPSHEYVPSPASLGYMVRGESGRGPSSTVPPSNGGQMGFPDLFADLQLDSDQDAEIVIQSDGSNVATGQYTQSASSVPCGSGRISPNEQVSGQDAAGNIPTARGTPSSHARTSSSSSNNEGGATPSDTPTSHARTASSSSSNEERATGSVTRLSHARSASSSSNNEGGATPSDIPTSHAKTASSSSSNEERATGSVTRLSHARSSSSSSNNEGGATPSDTPTSHARTASSSSSNEERATGSVTRLSHARSAPSSSNNEGGARRREKRPRIVNVGSVEFLVINGTMNIIGQQPHSPRDEGVSNIDTSSDCTESE